MKNLLIPVLLSAFVLPGAGQVFNKEKVKGFVFMGLFFALSVALVVVTVWGILPLLPPGGSPLSMLEIRALTTRLMVEKGTPIETVWWGLIAVWVYGILDAFLGARARARASGASR